MAESIHIDHSNTNKKARYEALIPQIEALVAGENDLIANLSNIAAALKEGMQFFWVGFYLVKDTQLVLGPFQGPVACTRINMGKGVCGYSWEHKQIVIVPNVEEFPGHIACSALSKSEIVLPAMKNKDVALILDVDSEKLADFDEEDAHQLGKIIHLIENTL